MSDPLLAAMRELYQRSQLVEPWKDWATRNSVELLMTDMCPDDQCYILTPGLDADYAVVMSYDFLRFALALMNDPVPPFPLQPQQLAEMIAWFKLELPEPADGQVH